MNNTEFIILHSAFIILKYSAVLHYTPPIMTALTADQVRHIAKLARLNLKEGEEEKFAKELSAILTYIDALQKVNTKSAEATAQITGLESIFREDRIRTDNVQPDALLATSPLPIIDHQIQTPSAHGST
ncbi:Asp-tRNA(Asn)/Glu-tRNA(Gln) amidotransferase subunit GatC [Candidatus Peregrinibacteria bacterium]|nr:Asp-tRNA(Asn)/Glu-tRNA(Gln) amidotransferase subunit GatC [Candidatus Peregrinibacteria bacterium]